MPEQNVVNRPYCRECFSKKRRRITNGFLKLEQDVTRNGEKDGLAPEQIEEIQAEIREKLAARLEEFDRECLSKARSTVTVV